MSLDEKVDQVHGFRDKTHYRIVPAPKRLGIPELLVTNGPAGVGPGGAGSQKKATSLTAPIALAASWDPQLAYQYGEVAAKETIDLGYNLLEAPDINIARVQQGGRVFESYGEDPRLVGRLAIANLHCIQSMRVIANVKHFAANNQETNRCTINEIIGERALHEIYLPAFEAAIKDGHFASIMCAYPGLMVCTADKNALAIFVAPLKDLVGVHTALARHASNRCARRKGGLHNTVLLLCRTIYAYALPNCRLGTCFDGIAHSDIVGPKPASGKTAVR
jgi:hypothetical protein